MGIEVGLRQNTAYEGSVNDSLASMQLKANACDWPSKRANRKLHSFHQKTLLAESRLHTNLLLMSHLWNYLIIEGPETFFLLSITTVRQLTSFPLLYFAKVLLLHDI